MKKIMYLVAALVLCAASSGPSRGDTNLKYYGYYGSIFNNLEDSSAATADHANVVWVDGSSSIEVAGRIRRASCLGHRTVLVATDFFFVKDDGKWKLRSDWSERWNGLANEITPIISDVIAIYPMDEPDRAEGMTDAKLNTAISAIRQRFPDVPVAAIYTHNIFTFEVTGVPVIRSGVPAIQSFDWVGTDCYHSYPLKCNGVPYATAFSLLKSAARPGAKFFMVPQAFTNSEPYSCVGCDRPYGMREGAKYLHQLAKNDSSVIGVFPYIYNNAGGGIVGVKNIPDVKPTFVSIGSEITSKSPLPPTRCIASTLQSIHSNLLLDH